MKQLLSMSIFSAFIFTSQIASAIPSFPRDLVCRNRAGTEITLSSNNSFWSHAENGRYSVELIIDDIDDGIQVLNLTSANDKARHTRGNDQGNRRYVFESDSGQKFQVELEFVAPHGQATAIKIFEVKSSKLNFKHTQTGSDGNCRVVFHPRTEI
jgi:hypothetical protein